MAVSAHPAVDSDHPRRWRWVSYLRWTSVAVLLGCLGVVLAARFVPVPVLYPSLPRITHTSRGAAGDPLNLLLIGSQAQLQANFARAGWLVPDPITPATSARIVAASLAHQPYPHAPVSPLYMFGRVQDLVFERPTSDVQNRGHVRLWLTPLQRDGQPVWVGQASYDHGIELSGTSGFPTHHISPAVDLERDAVGADLARTGLMEAEAYDPFTAPILVAYNGGGDYYTSDGEVLLLSYSSTAAPLPKPAGIASVVAAVTRGLWHAYAVVLTTLPLAIGVIVAVVLLVGFALWPALSWRRRLQR